MDFKTKDMATYTKTMNNLTFSNYYYRLELLSKALFKWNNLPNHISERWIENYLFSEGECMFFKDDTLGFMVAKCSAYGELNFYEEPTHLTPIATNYTNAKPYALNKECVRIQNNVLSYPTVNTIELYAYRLADITRTIDINVHAQKTPVLFKGSDKTLLTLRNIYAQYNGNAPVMYHDKNFDESFGVYKTDAPIVFPQLQVQKHALWNEVMTFLGIQNANQEKKERLVESEVNANDEQVEYSIESMLQTRQEACKLINEIFDLDVSVELRTPQNLPNIDSEVLKKVVK